ncbi:hypothetical protein NA56DRAFT_712932 [Hyaloscypha hepaticicola]|uniref:Uncharacterized protein n=1 Tax=Hyaloscypha hepaticicola TaxID=2082293 RepID=A0A2J6PF64_9HELO|nr:hypothetical protein NA56DRAFT_712932 [Hyaloscypha hepaticicola]
MKKNTLYSAQSENLLQASAVLVNGSSCTVNTNAKMRILAIGKTPITACPDTGSPVSFVERATLSKHFPYQQVQNLDDGLNLSFQGLGGMALGVNTFVDLPIWCKTTNSYMYFPPVRAYVVDRTPENVVLLGLDFIIPNALDFRWARKGGFATHRLQIGDTRLGKNTRYRVSIRYRYEYLNRKMELDNTTRVPVYQTGAGLVRQGREPRNSFHAILLDECILAVPLMLVVIVLCIELTIVLEFGRERLQEHQYLLSVNLFLAGWVGLHCVAAV